MSFGLILMLMMVMMMMVMMVMKVTLAMFMFGVMNGLAHGLLDIIALMFIPHTQVRFGLGRKFARIPLHNIPLQSPLLNFVILKLIIRSGLCIGKVGKGIRKGKGQKVFVKTHVYVAVARFLALFTTFGMKIGGVVVDIRHVFIIKGVTGHEVLVI